MLNYYRSGTPIPATFTSLPGSLTIKDVDSNGVVLNVTNPAGKTLRIWENGVQLSVPALTASDTTYAIELNPGKHYKFELLLSDGKVLEYLEVLLMA